MPEGAAAARGGGRRRIYRDGPGAARRGGQAALGVHGRKKEPPDSLGAGGFDPGGGEGVLLVAADAVTSSVCFEVTVDVCAPVAFTASVALVVSAGFVLALHGSHDRGRCGRLSSLFLNLWITFGAARPDS